MTSKILIFTFSVFYSLITFSQLSENDLIVNFNRYIQENNSWKKKSNFKSSANDTILLKSLLKDTMNDMYYCFEDTNFSDFKSDFYFIDLDLDKQEEIIYSGRICGGYESKSVAVFKKIKEKYVQVLIVGGKISNITKSDFVVNQYPCCSDRWHSLFNYHLVNDSLKVRNAVTFFVSDKFYKSKIKMTPFESRKCLVNDSVFCYNINFKDEDYQEFSEMGWAFLGRLKKEKELEVYDVLTDRFGTKWFYCKVGFEDLNVEGFVKHKEGVVFVWIKTN